MFDYILPMYLVIPVCNSLADSRNSCKESFRRPYKKPMQYCIPTDHQSPWQHTNTKVTKINTKVKVKISHYRPVVAQRVGTDIALLFHDRGTRRGWGVSSTPRPHFTPGKVHIPILQEAGWAPGPVWMGGKSRPHRDSTPDRPDKN